MITVKNFVENFKNKKIPQTASNEKSRYLRSTLEIKTYLPFKEKRAVVEMVVEKNISVVDGIKKYDNINSYISFVIAMLSAHTILTFSEDPVADYDLLAESGLLPNIIDEFKADYDECDALLKMTLAAELEDNNFNVLVGRFLDGILKKFDGIDEILKNVIGNINFKEEDLAKLKGFLDRYNK